MDDRTRGLFAALETDDWDGLYMMLDADPQLVNARDGDGNMLLHLVIRQRQAEHVQHLLEMGADANAVADNGMTPLVLAKESACSPELASILVEHGADPNAIDVDGFSVLERVIGGGDMGWVAPLLEAGACPQPTLDRQNYPLLEAAFFGLHLTARKLLVAGASVSDGPARWLTPLHVASRRGHVSFVDLLLKHGADPDDAGREDCCLGLRKGSWEEQLRQPADALSSWLMSPLALAAVGGHLAVCECLLKAGADPNCKGVPANTPLLHAAAAGNAGLVELLLDHGALANLGRKDGTTPLLLAVEGDHIAAVSVLLARGAVANAADETGWTPLMQAALDSTPGLIGMLLAKDASVFACDDRGRAPLRVAAEGDNVEGLKDLLAAGSPVNLPDLEGNTPLHAAAKSRFADCVPALLAAGADATARNKAGATPYDLAMEAGHSALAAMLRVLETGEETSPA